MSVNETLRVYFSLTNEEIVLSFSVSSFLVLTFKKISIPLPKKAYYGNRGTKIVIIP